jgi:hypothetical protein
MSEGEFYRKAAAASLAPKALIGLALGVAAGALSFVGLSGVLAVGLVPLGLWICGKGTEKNGDNPEENAGEYKPSWIDKAFKLVPGSRKFLNRLTPSHRRILGQTIKMDVALEMEMMTLAAIALGASGLATAGVIGFCATVGLVPVVALAATAIVWSTAFGVRKLRNFIAKRERAVAAGTRQRKRIDKFLKFVDNKIEPTLGLVGKVALLAVGGGLLIGNALIPLAHMAIPHLSASVAHGVKGVINVFQGLPAIAQLAVATPIGYGLGKFVYNPLIKPALKAIKRIAGKAFGRNAKKQKPPSGPAPSTEPTPSGKIGTPGDLRSSFEGHEKSTAPSQSAKVPEIGKSALNLAA